MMLAFLPGCAKEHFEELACPNVVVYSCEAQAMAANELAAGKTPTLMRYMQDYSVIRDQARNCAGLEKPKPHCPANK